MTAYEITVDGKHAARVHVTDPISICAVVARIREVYDTPIDFDEDTGAAIYGDVEEGGVEIIARIAAT